jgi:multicomponent Na+:H+ antiporter subunit B
MPKDSIIISSVTLFILPYIFLYSLYVQINGEISPGGGFQAGAIFASATIALDLIQKSTKLVKFFNYNLLVCTSSFGLLIYATTGLVSLMNGRNYLDYYALCQDKFAAQAVGIFIIELGVGLTVSSSMCLIYSLLGKID